MKKLIKGFTAYIIMFSICASMFGVPILAEDLDPPPDPSAETPAQTEKRMLYVDFLGTEDTPFTEASPQEPNFTTDNKGDKFWIGVAVDKVNDLSLFRNGVYSVEVSFEYDPVFVKPYALSNKPDEEWQTELIKGNLSNENNSLFWNTDQYEIISVRTSEIDVNDDRDLKGFAVDRKAAGWEKCTVCITLKDNTDFSNTRFMNLDDKGKQYLVKIPFILVSAPAEGDENQNPPALSLVRGPETLNIGAGEDGFTPFSAWEATVTDPDDITNMKTLFSFGGDISLFGKAASIKNIIAKKPIPEEETEETEETEYKLSRTKQLEEEEFDSDVDKYYLSVPNETDKLKLYIETSEPPTSITANGESIDSQLDGSFYVTEFDLVELNKDTANGGEEDGFNNTVMIESGSSTYTIYIRRLLKPKIVLNYGNSPYGEIMRSNRTEKEKEEAIAEFKETRVFNDVSNGLVYYKDAWKTYAEKYAERNQDGEIISLYDGDLDPTALFVFQRKPFQDPGFKLYDSEGELITDSDVINSVELSLSMNSYVGGFATYTDADKIQPISQPDANGNNYVFQAFTGYDIRPDIYILEYTFTDPKSSAIIKEKRKIMAISKHGDVSIDANNTLQGADATEITTHITAFSAETMNSLYKFRIADTDINENKVIQGADATEIKTHIATGLPEFYRIISGEE